MSHNLPLLIESLRNNSGDRSVTRVTLPPDAKALPHFHSLYNETFVVHSGWLTVIHNSGKHRIGQDIKSYTIPKRDTHAYKNDSGGEVVVDFILEPGHDGCEKTNDIIAGLARDKRLAELSRLGGYTILWCALYDLTNTIPVGIPGLIFSTIRLIHGNVKIERIKNQLLNQYCNLKFLKL